MYEGHTVGVVVPAYNEEGEVGRVIDTIPSFVDRVYVVDDGSTDGTWDEIRRHADARNALGSPPSSPFETVVEPIQHDRNRGVGGAIKTGYRAALRDGIAVTAVLGGDGQMDPDELWRYVDPVVHGVADYAKGNRFMRPEDLSVSPRFRLLGNVVLSTLTMVASGYWGSMDSQNGYAAISRDALERLDLDGLYEYYGYCNDLLVRLNVIDARVADVERSAREGYEGEWKSHIRYWEYIPRVSVMLLRGFIWRLWHKHVRGDRHPLAACYLAGMGLLVAGPVGAVASLLLAGSAGGIPTSLAVTLVGALLFLSGAVLDRWHNQSLSLDIAQDPVGAEVDVRDAAIAGGE